MCSSRPGLNVHYTNTTYYQLQGQVCACSAYVRKHVHLWDKLLSQAINIHYMPWLPWIHNQIPAQAMNLQFTEGCLTHGGWLWCTFALVVMDTQLEI